MNRKLAGAFALIAIVALATIPLAHGQGKADAAKTLDGQLLKIDPAAKSLSVKTADDKEATFMYTDQTQIKGADKGVQGLATQEGAHVRVSYIERNGVNVATQIEVMQK